MQLYVYINDLIRCRFSDWEEMLVGNLSLQDCLYSSGPIPSARMRTEGYSCVSPHAILAVSAITSKTKDNIECEAIIKRRFFLNTSGLKVRAYLGEDGHFVGERERANLGDVNGPIFLYTYVRICDPAL